jgi:pimeloyl-ACP methyl ester carboxylesterase
MAGYLDIAGHPTWVDDRGSGDETIVLLHGGMSNGDELMDAIGAALLERYRVVAFDRRGHGRTADTDEPLHYDDMATETIEVLADVVGGPAHLVGWSDGGIVALLVAMRRPDLVGRLVPIGANFHYDGVLSLDFPPDSPVAQQMFQDYVDRSPDGPEHFGVLFEKFLAMATTEPTLTVDDLATIAAPALVLVGDDDLIRFDHTWALYDALPQGQLAVVPGASHGVPAERPADVARLVLDFLAADVPPRTLIPVRRAAG